MADKVQTVIDSMVRNLETKTGKSLDTWIGIARRSGLSKHGEIIQHLKAEYGLGHGYANLVAHRALGSPSGGGAPVEGLVERQYAGPKAGLKAIYDALVTAVAAFGDDVEVSPKKTYVSLRRSKQFALIQPSSSDRVDVGINLKGVAPGGRLEAPGSFNAMVSHRVRVRAREEVDAELLGWLRRAYDAS